jgi:glycosyltransferase involved in cell wall biosynthesis
MKKLAVILPTLRGGGAERATVKLAAGLHEAGVHTQLVVAENGGVLRREVPAGLEIVDLGTSRVAAGLPALARYLRAVKPHTLLSVMVHANVIAAWARGLSGAPTRIVMSERTMLSIALPHLRRPSVRWLLPRLVPSAYARAAAIVAVSDGVKQDLVARFGADPGRVHVIHNPVVTPALEATGRRAVAHPWLAGSGARDAAGGRGGAGAREVPVVVAAGRLHPCKDFGALIRAFARARRQRHLRLLILGAGDERPRLESLVARLGVGADVPLPGFVDDVPASLSRAALFVLSSRWEGLPGVVIEALAMGCPVVATDCPSGPREILEDGRLGRLVPPGDEAALSAAMLATLAAPRDPAALRRRAEDFSLRPIVGRYREVLEV